METFYDVIVNLKDALLDAGLSMDEYNEALDYLNVLEEIEEDE